MKTLALRGLLAAGAASAALAIVPAQAHHSFAAYTDAIGFSFVGVVTAVVPDANHLVIQFAVINADRTGYVYAQERDPETGQLRNREVNGQPVPVVANLEFGGAAGMANDGVTVSRFQPGTIISISANPLRQMLPEGVGVQGGSQQGGALFTAQVGGDAMGTDILAVCSFGGEPPRLPPPGEFCGSVEGATFFDDGMGMIPETTESGGPVVEWASWAFSPTTVSGDVIQDFIFE